MDSNEFRKFGKEAVDFIADYLDNIRDRDVLPSVEPGYLQKLLPDNAPELSEDWKTIMSDFKNIIMPGITHWQSPNFHAFYPTPTSFPTIIGEMLSAGLGVVGFNWISSPVCTELETIVMDWLAKIFNLPEHFLHSDSGSGGGVIHSSASESIVVSVIAARNKTIKRIQNEMPELTLSEIHGKLIIYSSDQSNVAIEKSSKLTFVKIRLLESDENCCLTGATLQAAIEEDLKKGLIPAGCIATLGTTGTCSFDKIDELGPVCQQYKMWLHVDAAYAGVFFCCPEYRSGLQGIEFVDSININLHKRFMVNYDCTAAWVKNSSDLTDALGLDRIYLSHEHEGKTNMPDYRNWQIQLGRRFRALKVWIVLRTYGIEKIRSYLRLDTALADRFAQYIEHDNRFEIITTKCFGLVVFRLKGENCLSETLHKKILQTKKLFMVPVNIKNKFAIRFVVGGMEPNVSDIDFAWELIDMEATKVLCKKIPTMFYPKTNKRSFTEFSENLENVVPMEIEKSQ